MKPQTIRKFAFLAIIFFLCIAQVQAKGNGVGDQNLNLSFATGQNDNNGPNCGTQCHQPASTGATMSISAGSCCNYTAGKTGININATTSFPTTGGDILGILLLNNTSPLSGNIINDGWIITLDPNNNPTKYNYNEKSALPTLNQTYIWTITAPGKDGTYYMKAQARYGKSGSPTPYGINSSVLTLAVDGTPPQVISNTNNIYVATGTILTLNASITDALGGVMNATVNVSGINSTINEAILTRGSYWLNTTIIADRGDTTLKNLTITAYDYFGNVNKTINMTVGIDNTPPSVISNTNNAMVLNGTNMALNATITDALSGVKNVTVNVSAANRTINQAVLTLQGGYWINNSIIADRGVTGFVNLPITAYDNVSNINNTVNMTVRIYVNLPNITSWSNNYTSNNTLSFNVPTSTYVNFNVTANQTVTYKWEYDGSDQGQNYNNLTKLLTSTGLHYINATVSNANGSDYKNWTLNVVNEVIDVTLSNIPVDFGSLSPGASNQSSSLPLNVTIQGTTNVNVNLTLNGSNFVSGIYSFGVGNLTYSNSSAGTKTAMTNSYPFPPYNNWSNIPKLVTSNRSIYLWLSIPVGQEPGSYSNNVNIRAERYT